MQHRSTFTIKEENFVFLNEVSRGNRSAYINAILEEKKQQLLAEEMLLANKEEATGEYLSAIQGDWDAAMYDGLGAHE